MKNMNPNQLNQEQLALLGAAFVAGYGVGSSGGSGPQPPSQDLNAEIPASIHQVPQIPIVLDGKNAAPEQVKEFDGKPLYSIFDERASAGEILHVFTDRQKALQYCKKTTPSKRSLADDVVDLATTTDFKASDITEGDPFIGAARLFEHINFQGSVWDMYAMNGNVPDFRQVLCFLWWCQNINDRVSSIDNQVVAMAVYRPKRAFTVLHENINFSGSQLWIVERQMVSSLIPSGWNDRASSCSFHLI